MKNKVIDKSIVEGIVRSDNSEFVEKIDKRVNLILSNAVNDLSGQIAYINLDNSVLQPVNENLNGGITDNSKYVYFLGVDNTQLELNTLKSTTFWKDLKNKLIWAWQNRNYRRRRRALKKKAKQDKLEGEAFGYDFDPSKYNIYMLCEDLHTAIAKYAKETSVIYLEGDKIRIIGKDEFGPTTQIEIYPVIFDGEVFKYYAGRKKGFINVDIFARTDKINEKYKKVGENLINMIKVFNVLYYFANKAMPNQIFIESLLCYCPDELFKGDDVYTVFVKIINYLNMTSIKDVPSLCNPEKTIFQDELSESSGYGYERFMNQFVYLNEKESAAKKTKQNKK